MPMTSPKPTSRRVLAEALATLDSPVCKRAALEVSQGLGPVSLALRSAGLGPRGAAFLSRAIRLASTDPALRLMSLSLSYNPIGDEGAQALAGALPASVRELGLVGCEIGDPGASAIHRWAAHAPQLRMLCIESNMFSREVAVELHRLKAMVQT